MATALLALSEGPGGFRKLSVIKQLRLDLCHDPEFVAMFLDEARIAALVNHPNVVQTNEVGAEGNNRFISMEYLQGQSLSRVLYRLQGLLPLGMHVRVLADTLAGLHYVHELKDLSGEELEVVHRDISPGNLFLTYEGDVKVLDFGIAKATGSRAVTEVGSFKGKMAYVAPEQARGSTVDRRADVVSMGGLLWEALAKRPMVPRDEDDVISLEKRVKGLEASIDQEAPNTPKALREVCEKAMALNPDDRYSTADEFRDALLEASEGLKGGARKDLATVMTKLFAAEREAIAATIAKTISKKDSFKSDVEMISSWEASTSMSQRRLKLDDAITEEITKDDYAGFEPYSQVESASQVEVSSLASTVLPLTVLAKPTSYRKAAIFVAALSLVIGFAAYFTGSGKDSPAVEESVAGDDIEAEVDLVDEETKEPTPDSIALQIEVIPRGATLSLDGKRLTDNPFTGNRALSRDAHEFVASALGYQTIRRTIRFDKDIVLKLELALVEGLEPEVSQIEEKQPEVSQIEEKRTLDKEVESTRKKTAEKEATRRKKKAAKETSRVSARAKEGETGTVVTAKEPAPTQTTPKPGDELRRKRENRLRNIDKDNPYK